MSCPEGGGEAEAERREAERREEDKLKAKFPGAAASGHSAFLQKKLAKGTKYFDSGDYQMARQTLSKLPVKSRLGPPTITQALLSTGEVIPTVDTVPVRKTSIIQPKFQTSAPVPVVAQQQQQHHQPTAPPS